MRKYRLDWADNTTRGIFAHLSSSSFDIFRFSLRKQTSISNGPGIRLAEYSDSVRKMYVMRIESVFFERGFVVFHNFLVQVLTCHASKCSKHRKLPPIQHGDNQFTVVFLRIEQKFKKKFDPHAKKSHANC